MPGTLAAVAVPGNDDRLEGGPTDSVGQHGDAFTVEVVRSARRKRTVGAQLRGSVLRVSVPGWMSRADERRWVEQMTESFRRRTRAERLDLPRRAARLASTYGLPTPAQVSWSDSMTARWGSCSPERRTIAISTRLAPFPDWVVDSVIMHELCHLVVPHHGAEFWELANRYPKMERAIGYLMAKSEHPVDGDARGDAAPGDGADDVDLDGD